MGLGGRCPNMSDAQFAKIISRRLKHKRFLLLLDDVRAGGIDLSAIGLPMPLVGHRQKVVFTTRDQAVCAAMGCTAANTIQMQCLGEDDAWDLFKCYVGHEILYPNAPMEDIAKKIVAEFRGFPSALCTIGRSMSNRTKSYQWIVAYDMLMIKRPLPDDIKEMSDVGYPCLRFFEDELGDPLF